MSIDYKNALRGHFYYSKEQSEICESLDSIDSIFGFGLSKYPKWITTCLIDGVEYPYTEMTGLEGYTTISPHKHRFPDSVYLGMGRFYRKIASLDELEVPLFMKGIEDFCNKEEFRKWMINAFVPLG